MRKADMILKLLRPDIPLILSVFAVCLSTAGAALAQTPSPQASPPVTSAPSRSIDLTSATCAQFMALARADKDQIVLWLSGFYAGGAQRPRIDVDLLADASRAMDELCAKTPAAPLLGQETRPLLFR
jgi:HdeA/HdeB family